MSKSCENCVNFIGRNDADRKIKLYGSALPGIETCSAKGLLLGWPDMSPEDAVSLRRDRAAKCQSYGVKRSTERVALTVGLPNPAVNAPEPKARQPIGSCSGCFFSVPASEVEERTGVYMTLCAKYGKAIPEGALSSVGSKCSSGTELYWGLTGGDDIEPSEYNKMVESHRRKLANTLIADPHLSDRGIFGFLGVMNEYTESESIEDPQEVIDPLDWPTDAAVTESHKKQGIQAWRKLTAPNGKRSTLIPVFSPDFFSDDERKLIPKTGSEEHPELYRDHQGVSYKAAVLWREMDETPAVVGPSGVGKTELFRYMAWMMQLPFERVSITRRSELDDLAGKVGYTPEKGTHFQHGRIPQAWSKPCVIVIDEPNVGPPEVWQFLRPLTDNSKQLVLDMNEGEVISRNENCYFGMAMNPAWDARNIGAEEISDADGRRLMHVWMGLPSQSEEKRIIRERCNEDGFEIDGDSVNALMRIAKRLRDMSNDGVIPVTWGLANQIKTARALNWFDFPDAFRLAVVDQLEPEAADLILDVVREFMPMEK